ncbi:hypothetical protein JXA85_04320 [Candidatus Woesearchaeota archaeon]|nr:hypothetical protein [Candidatus Woesearchaeota archaeon]
MEVLGKTKELAQKLGMRIVQDKETYLLIHPHPNSETVSLNFCKWKDVRKIKDWDYCKETMNDYEKVISDEEFVCSSFTKTQYAGCKTHILVAEMLRKIAARCSLSHIYDEAGYYETGNAKKASVNFDKSTEMISKMAAMLKEAFGSENVYCSIDNLKE